jgi:hypothetical protein
MQLVDGVELKEEAKAKLEIDYLSAECRMIVTAFPNSQSPAIIKN